LSEARTIDVCVEITPYTREHGAISSFDDDALLEISVEAKVNSVVIAGNRSGLRSLARHLLTLAHEMTPSGSHIDVDDYAGWFTEESLGVRFEVDDGMIYISETG
jgi:hypothetical protein